MNANSLVPWMSHYLCKRSGLRLYYLVACFHCFFFPNGEGFSGGGGWGGGEIKAWQMTIFLLSPSMNLGNRQV